jgi:hypothetical protein
MTAVSSVGYAAVYLTPNSMADFSQGESVIRFDMSTLRTSSRDWVDLVIMPFEDNQQLNFQDASVPANAIHIEMFNSVGSTRFRASIVREFQRSGLPFNDVAYDSFLTPDPARRDTFEIRVSRNHLRFGMPAYNFAWVDADISPALNWSQGIVQLNTAPITRARTIRPPARWSAAAPATPGIGTTSRSRPRRPLRSSTLARTSPRPGARSSHSRGVRRPTPVCASPARVARERARTCSSALTGG